MDFETARQFVLKQTLDTGDDMPDRFMLRLHQGRLVADSGNW